MNDNVQLETDPDYQTQLITVSESIIAQEAPSAIRVLTRLDALDLADMLGLTPYLKEA